MELLDHKDTKLADIAIILDIEPIYVNEVMKYIFNSRFKGVSEHKAPVFDYLRDFDLIFACFKRYYNIDLNKDNLNWWEFTAILEDLLTTETSISKRIEIRDKKIPKKADRDYVNSMNKLKAKYRLQGNIQQDTTQKGLKGLFDFLKSKAKEG